MTTRQILVRVLTIVTLALGVMAGRPAAAASLQAVSSWGATGVPSYISMYIYVPTKMAPKPPILVVSHFCGGSASAVFGQAQSGGIVSAADTYGFIMIFPQTTNNATSAKCWDVGSKASLTHDGGGDTQAVAQMVKYTVTKYNANADRVYATGDSSGGMMTQALMGVYPDVFKGGSSFAGVAAGCWSSGWSAASNWGGTCAGGKDIMTAQQWGDLVRGMYPGYTGHRPRVQLFHGDADPTINYANYGESVKEWTNVLGLATAPTTTTSTGIMLGTHQAARQQWKNACGYVVLDGLTSKGGDHGPSDALFVSTYVVPFLGLDNTDAVDPEIAACGANSAGGASGSGGAGGGKGGAGGTPSVGSGGVVGHGGAVGNGGSVGAGGKAGTGGATGAGSGGVGSGGNVGSGGSATASGGASSGGAVGTGGITTASGGVVGSGGKTSSGGASATGGSSGTGGASADAGGGDGSSGGGCAIAAGRSNGLGDLGVGLAFGLALVVVRRRRGRSSR